MLRAAGGLYATHLRTESEAILDAIDEACEIGRAGDATVVVSHLKCAGVDNWGRSAEVLRAMDAARLRQSVAWDCYPYAAGSSTLDLRQVDPRVEITITWSKPHPEQTGRLLARIAEQWGVAQVDAARKLQPAGAIYHSIHEDDMRRILAHPATMIGSDGLPHDPHPHPRLWGAFPRVLGRYCRDAGLFWPRRRRAQDDRTSRGSLRHRTTRSAPAWIFRRHGSVRRREDCRRRDLRRSSAPREWHLFGLGKRSAVVHCGRTNG